MYKCKISSCFHSNCWHTSLNNDFSHWGTKPQALANVAFLKLDSWFEPNDVLVLNIQLSYQTFPIPPAIADSIPLHEALRTRLSWPLFWLPFWLNWLKWLESLGLATWRFSPFFARSGHPPNQAIVDNFSELETQSLIVRCLDPSHGFDNHEDVGDFVVDICCCLSWNSVFEAQLDPLPMETLPADEPNDLLLSLSESFLLASRRAAATSMVALLMITP